MSDSSYIVVIAEYINQYQFSFQCPFCYSRHRRDGKPYKNAKRVYHYHGSNGDLSDRIEYRNPHCLRCPPELSQFVIHINEHTKRKPVLFG
jgi:hypothetical protein